ncbi:MAG: GIY-YIG nuclease family protein [Anaerolineae bacterium]|nr:GIY-YIG nuclease family protein [Anaerolineae bacterium]
MLIELISSFPPEKGVYILSFSIDEPVDVRIGSLGIHQLPWGLYHYCGSARGSGGLRARLQHHLASRAHPHWHLDYLREWMRPLGCLFVVTEDNLECSCATLLNCLADSSVPIPRFGASDCQHGCPAHLIQNSSLTPGTIRDVVRNGIKNGIRYNWENSATPEVK